MKQKKERMRCDRKWPQNCEKRAETRVFYKNISQANRKRFTKITQNLESFNKVKLNLAEFNGDEPKNKKVESRSRLQNWLIQAGYFGSAMLRKKSS